MSGELINAVLEYIEGSYGASEIVVVEAPPAYGKSTSVPTLAGEFHERELAGSFIHVLPLRAIIDNILRNFYLAAFDPNKVDPRLEKARVAFQKMGIGRGDVAYQMCMDLMLRESGDEGRASLEGTNGSVIRKSPAFDARAVVATLDSFAYNVMRAPVIDSFKSIKRYAILRARMFASSVFLDEAHMILRYPEEESTEKMLCFLRMLIEYSLGAKIPLVVLSATLGEWFKQKIAYWSQQRVKIFTLGQEEKIGKHTLGIRDEDFLEQAKGIRWGVELVEEKDVVKKARELVESGRRVLIVRDRIRDALENYLTLKDEVNTVLIHGQLTVRDRALATYEIEELQKNCSSGFAVVATPIVEAGVNWDFDVAFRDATNTFSLVQVSGRVCRNPKGDREGEIYLITSKRSNPRLIEFINKVKSEKRQINWRIPFDYTDGGEVYGYERVINLQDGLERLRESNIDIYETLFFAFMLPSKSISALEKEMNYSLLREPLAHFFVGQLGEFGKSELNELVDQTVTYSLSLLQGLKDKVRGFAAVGICTGRVEEDLSVKIKLIKSVPESENDYIHTSRELIRKLAEEGADPLLTCYIVDERAYEERVGFRLGTSV